LRASIQIRRTRLGVAYCTSVIHDLNKDERGQLTSGF
jgi:hypothetical protein